MFFGAGEENKNNLKKKCQKCSNSHERSGIDWTERKIKFHIFPIFIFWVMVIFWSFLWRHHPNFRWIFHDSSENNNRRIFLLFFFHSTHRIIHKIRIKTEGRVICISLVRKKPKKVMKSTVNRMRASWFNNGQHLEDVIFKQWNCFSSIKKLPDLVFHLTYCRFFWLH